MTYKAITMLGLAGLLLALSAPFSVAQTTEQAVPVLVQPRPAAVNKAAAEAEAAADTTLIFYNIRNRLFDVSLQRTPDFAVRAVGIIFDAPFDGTIDRVDFELSDVAPSPGVAGTGTLRIKLVEIPFVVTDPPFQPGDSVEVDLADLEARGFVAPGDFANQIDVSEDDFDITEGDRYFLQLALVEESNDAAVTFVFDGGSDDPDDENYFIPPDSLARTLVYIDSTGAQMNNCGDPTEFCDDFVSLRDPIDTDFVHLNVLLEVHLSRPPPPPPPDANAFMQFIHNVPNVGMVDVYLGDSLIVDDIDYQQASLSGGVSFLQVRAGAQTLDLVPAADSDNSNPVFSKTVNLAENQRYWAVASGVPDQTLDVFVEPASGGGGQGGKVPFMLMHGADGADPIDLNILDETPMHAVVMPLVDDLGFGEFKGPVPFESDSTYNIEVASGTTQLDVFRLEVVSGGGFEEGTRLMLTSGLVVGAPPLALLIVDAMGAVTVPPVSTATEDLAVPEAFALHGNFPNPFNPTTTIRFDLGAPGFTTLAVYNILGQEVATLVAEPLAAGAYEMVFDAATLPSGPYLYRLTSGSLSQQRLLMLVK